MQPPPPPSEVFPFEPKYRPCVGLMVLNRRGQVFLGQRAGAEDSQYSWQMPQGGIDEGETPERAAWRELAEETSMMDVILLGESTSWLTYDLPKKAMRAWKGGYKGQAQKWFVFRFLGEDSSIDLTKHESIEFSDWRWHSLEGIVDLIVPFKRPVYEAIVSEFRSYTKYDI